MCVYQNCVYVCVCMYICTCVCAFACVYVYVAGGWKYIWVLNQPTTSRCIQEISFVPIQWKTRNGTMALTTSRITWAVIWKKFSARRTNTSSSERVSYHMLMKIFKLILACVCVHEDTVRFLRTQTEFPQDALVILWTCSNVLSFSPYVCELPGQLSVAFGGSNTFIRHSPYHKAHLTTMF